MNKTKISIFMRITSLASLLLACFMLLYGCNQLFIVDPAVASDQYFPNIITTFTTWFITGIALILIVLAILLFTGLRAQVNKKSKKLSSSKLITLLEPPGKDKLEIFMLISFLLSAIGTFSHDTVVYGLGALSFVLPIFLDPYIGRKRVTEVNNTNERSGKQLNWDMIGAAIALVALAWEVLIHFL